MICFLNIDREKIKTNPYVLVEKEDYQQQSNEFYDVIQVFAHVKVF